MLFLLLAIEVGMDGGGVEVAVAPEAASDNAPTMAASTALLLVEDVAAGLDMPAVDARLE